MEIKGLEMRGEGLKKIIDYLESPKNKKFRPGGGKLPKSDPVHYIDNLESQTHNFGINSEIVYNVNLRVDYRSNEHLDSLLDLLKELYVK